MSIPVRLKAKDIAPLREKMLAEQDGECPLCIRTIGKPALDHDHGTGDIRAVLCTWCNANLGRIENAAHRIGVGVDPHKFLENCLAYLVQHDQAPSNIKHHTYKDKEEKKARAKVRAKKTRELKIRETKK